MKNFYLSRVGMVGVCLCLIYIASASSPGIRLDVGPKPGFDWTLQEYLLLKSQVLFERSAMDKAVLAAPDCPPVPTLVPYIGGRVYLDVGQDGALTVGTDPAIENVLISVFGPLGLIGTTTSSVDGDYLFQNPLLLVGTEYRVEFSNFPAGYEPSVIGADNASSVRYVSANSCFVDFGFHDPSIYCEVNPTVVTSCYAFGDQDGNATDVLISVPYQVTPNASEADDPSEVSHEAIASAIGTTYGLAYQRSSGILFAAAFMKRFSGFGVVGGTSRPGGIYSVSQPRDGNLSGSLFLDLDDLFGSAVSGGDIHDFTTLASNGVDLVDGAAFDGVGRFSFGDMDMAEDNLSLWVVNLSDRSLYNIPLGSDPTNPQPPTSSTEVSVVSLVNNLPNIPAGVQTAEIRPFGLKVRDGLVYVGYVGNGQSGGPLMAFAYSYDPIANVFTKVLEFPLNYNRGCGLGGNFGTGSACAGPANWQTWVSTFPTPVSLRAQFNDFDEIAHPQPMFTDIEFDLRGNMYIGLRDRFGEQGGAFVARPNGVFPAKPEAYDAFGDIIRATPSGSSWTVNIADFTDNSLSNGAVAPVGETVFGDDDYYDGLFLHEETAMGGLGIYHQSNQLVTPSMDPRLAAFSNGIDWFNLAGNTNLDKALTVLTPSASNSPFAKANGLGEIEIICNEAPLQIGNFVWEDTNLDGIQNPGEAPLENVPVALYDSATQELLAHTLTDANGNYLFSDNTVGSQNWIGSAIELGQNNAYVLVFGTDGTTPIFNIGTKQLLLGGATFNLTAANEGEGSQPDINDSDATIAPIATTPWDGFPYIVHTTGGAGAVAHTLDAAFYPCDISISKVTPSLCDGGAYSVDIEVTYGIIPLNTILLLVDGSTFTFNPTLVGGGSETFTIENLPCGQGVVDGSLIWTGLLGCSPIFSFLSPPIDPTGFIYCEENGEIITGGTISVTPPPGGMVNIIEDGSSGYYAFEGDTDGVYTISYNSPDGYQITTSRPVAVGAGPAGALDPSSGSADNPNGDDPLVIGTSDTTNMALDDFSAVANPYYLQVELEAGDPIVLYNNIPLEACVITCDISITNVVVNCTNDTDFTLDFDVNWDFSQANSDMITITVDGNIQTSFTPGDAMGSMSFGPVAVSGPAYGVLIEAAFDNFSTCATARSVDLIACTAACTSGLGGQVWNDYDNNGAGPDAGESGQENVLVEVYNCDGTLVCSTYTNSDGQWSCPALIDNTQEYRVEFSTPLQDYLSSSFVGMDNGTNTQFVAGGNCAVDYGVLAINYCGDETDGDPQSNDVQVAVTCFVNGSISAGGIEDVLVSYDYDQTGGDGTVYLATKAEMGSIWALAHDNERGAIYTAAFLKRHVGMGPEGPGAIYRHNLASGTNDLLVDLADFGADVGSTPTGRNLGNPGMPSHDPDAFPLVAKMAIGDIDVSDDNSTLYAMSLADKRVYEIDIASQSVTTSYLTPDPGCVNGEWRPFALTYHDGNVYVGGVCDASTGDRNDLLATVYLLSEGVFTTVIQFPLDYNKGQTIGECSGDPSLFHPWVDTFNELLTPACTGTANRISHPQPVLSDIEFDVDGSMILGFLDRTSHQTGRANYSTDTNSTTTYNNFAGGDILRAEPNGIGGYILENNGTSGGVTTAGANNNQGPGGGEYYHGDRFRFTGMSGFFNIHRETSLGGLALLPGSGKVLMTTYDPIDGGDQELNSAGVSKLSNLTGEKLDGNKRLYNNTDVGTFGKSGGLGDVELICPPAPLQLGNYVWIDEDEDGVQDACEDPVANLPVRLYTKNDDGTLTLVATTATDSIGQYYFTDSTNTDETWLVGTQVLKDTTYLIVFGDMPVSDSTFTFAGGLYTLSEQDSGEGSNPDLNDSDAIFSDVNGDTLPGICFNTADTTDHTQDVGLIPIKVSLGSTVFADANNNGVQDGGEAGIANVPIQLFDSTGTEILVGLDGILGNADDADGGTVTDPIGNYYFSNLDPGSYYVQIPASAFAMGTGPLENIPISSNTSSGTFAGETDPDDDVDNDDEGIQSGGAGTSVLSNIITLSGNAEPIDGGTETAQGNEQDNADDDNGNMTLDLGFFAPVAVGDTAFVDLGGDGFQSAGEPGIEGVKVSIFFADGTAVTTDAEGNAYNNMTTTAADGSYLFENLPPGNYYVVFDISMADNADLYNYTIQDADGNVSDEDDSDASPINGQTLSTGFLSSGQQDLSLDVGLVCEVRAETTVMALTLCGTDRINLADLGGSITPASLGGFWSSSGTGTFDDTEFGLGTTYTPSQADIAAGQIIITLTTNDPSNLSPPSECEPASVEVLVTILKVDCGTFPWDGNN